MKKLSRIVMVMMLGAGMSLWANGPLGVFSGFDKWKASEGTTIVSSNKHQTVGKGPVKVTITTAGKYPGILLENNGIFDLSKAKAMSFDCYNPGKPITFILKLKSSGKKFSKKFLIPAGQNKITIPLDDVKIDMSAVKYIKIWTKKRRQEVVLYFDNLQFVE